MPSLLDTLKGFLLPAAPAPSVNRSDGWYNPTLGYGDGLDKTSKTSFCPNWILSDAELSNLYYNDAIAATIVDFVPNELFRRGYELKSEKNQARADDILEEAKKKEVDKAVKSWVRWKRLYGSALLIPGLNDGQDLLTPLNPEAAQPIQWLKVVDKRYATVLRYGHGSFQEDGAKPEIFGIFPLEGTPAYVHASRVWLGDGVEVDPAKRRELAGWGMSVLQRPYDRLREFMTAFQSSSALLADASQSVFSLKDLWKQVALKGRKELQERMAMVDMTRSSSRAVLLDADGEKFERVATSFAGIPEMLDRYMMMLSAATGIPVTILMGRSAAGMNATGDADFRAVYDKIASLQDNEISPILMQIFNRFEGGAPDDLEICWLPLWEPSDKEKAETELLKAQACKVKADEYVAYIGAAVLHPEEVALAEFSDATNGEIEIDVSVRQEALKVSEELALQPPPAPGTDPNAPPTGEANGETQQPPQA